MARQLPCHPVDIAASRVARVVGRVSHAEPGKLPARKMAFLPSTERLSTTLAYDLELDWPDAVFWTPADWAWVGGWLDTVLPAWQHGQTVVSTQHRFNEEWAFDFMARHGVTHSFMTPTALKRLAQVPAPRERWKLATRVNLYRRREPARRRSAMGGRGVRNRGQRVLRSHRVQPHGRVLQGAKSPQSDIDLIDS